MGMGSSNLDINYSNDSAMKARLKGKTAAEQQDILGKNFGLNTTASSTPPPAATLDITDSRLAAARSSAALDVTAAQSRKESFASFGGGDAGLLARQRAIALLNKGG